MVRKINKELREEVLKAITDLLLVSAAHTMRCREKNSNKSNKIEIGGTVVQSFYLYHYFRDSYGLKSTYKKKM